MRLHNRVEDVAFLRVVGFIDHDQGEQLKIEDSHGKKVLKKTPRKKAAV